MASRISSITPRPNLQSPQQQQTTAPNNYDIFSLHKLLSISTGAYSAAPQTSDFIDTDQWEEVLPKYNSYQTDNMSEAGVPNNNDNGDAASLTMESATTPRTMEKQQQQQPDFMYDDVFFSNVLTKPQEKSKQQEKKLSKQPSLSASLADDASRPVYFKQVVCGGHKGLYSVLAMLCSNGVVLLRFVGTVDSIERDEEEDDLDTSSSGSKETNVNNSISYETNANDDDHDAIKDKTNVRLSCPIIRCVTYFKDNGIAIVSIALEESARWLACTTGTNEIFIVPVCRTFFPYNMENAWPFRRPQVHSISSSMLTVSQKSTLPSLKEYTMFITDSDKAEKKGFNFLNTVKDIQALGKVKQAFSKTKHGLVVCSVWWKSFEQKNYLIHGTDQGFVVIYNLQTQVEECIVSGLKKIKKIEVVSDPRTSYTYLLVHSRGLFFKLILELEDTDFHTYKSICKNYRVEGFDEEKQDVAVFKPVAIPEFSKEYPCVLNVQEHDKKGPFLYCFSKVNNQISHYDPDMFKYPLFAYQMNQDTSLVYPTDKLIFSAQRSSGDSATNAERIWVTSKQLASVGSQATQVWVSGQKLRTYAVFQEFHLPQEQRALGFLPNLLSGRRKHATDDDDGEVEGVIVWTQNSIFEIREKNVPQEIFAFMLANQKNSSPAKSTDQFGKTFNLNLFSMYEKSADEAFEKGHYETAINLYALSNVNETKYVQKLMQCQKISVVVDHLTRLLSNPASLSIYKRTTLSNLLFLSFMYCIGSEYGGNAENASEAKQLFSLATFDDAKKMFVNVSAHFWNQFCVFLHENADYDVTLVLQHLINRGLVALAIEVAHKKKTMMKALQLLLNQGITQLSTPTLEFFLNNGYAKLIYESSNVMLASSSPSIIIRYVLAAYFVNTKEQKQRANATHVSKAIQDIYLYLPFCYSEEILLSVAEIFNPETTVFNDTAITLSHKKMTTSTFYPCIAARQHIEIFLFAMIILSSQKTKNLELIVSQSSVEQQRSMYNHRTLYMYCQEKLEDCLRIASDYYRHKFIMSKCMQYDNLSALSIIYEVAGLVKEALVCRLRYVHATSQKTSDKVEAENKASKMILASFEKYVVKRADLEKEARAVLILKVFEYWKLLQLPSIKMEDFCIKHLQTIGDSLASILLSSTNQHPFLIPFSPKLYLKISQHFVKLLHKFKKAESKGNSNLQNQIIKNIDKDLLQRNSITMDVRNANAPQHYVVFSCNHQYESLHFFESIVPQFSMYVQSLADADDAVKLALATVELYYKAMLQESNTIVHQSCPACVQTTLKKKI